MRKKEKKVKDRISIVYGADKLLEGEEWLTHSLRLLPSRREAEPSRRECGRAEFCPFGTHLAKEAQPSAVTYFPRRERGKRDAKEDGP
jgi:hypothetical protein